MSKNWYGTNDNPWDGPDFFDHEDDAPDWLDLDDSAYHERVDRELETKGEN